jgi:hypothetical protein
MSRLRFTPSQVALLQSVMLPSPTIQPPCTSILIAEVPAQPTKEPLSVNLHIRMLVFDVIHIVYALGNMGFLLYPKYDVYRVIWTVFFMTWISYAHLIWALTQTQQQQHPLCWLYIPLSVLCILLQKAFVLLNKQWVILLFYVCTTIYITLSFPKTSIYRYIQHFVCILLIGIVVIVNEMMLLSGNEYIYAIPHNIFAMNFLISLISHFEKTVHMKIYISDVL